MDTTVASPLVAAIERAWSAIQARHEDVPEVVVTIASGSQHTGMKWGHFAPERWERGADVVHEVFIGGEGLSRGARATLGTLIHEAAHAAARVRGIQDTSRQGRYHNGRFRQIGESFGLTLTQDARIGWSCTEVPDATADDYAETIADLAAAITAYRRSPGSTRAGGATGTAGGTTTGKPKNGHSLTCGCATPRRIRVSASTHDAGPIICGVCGDEFTDR